MNEEIIAYIRRTIGKLRIGASKEKVETAGLNNWEKERRDSLFGSLSVRWDLADGDEFAYRRIAAGLAQLWGADSSTGPAFKLEATRR